MRTDSGKQSNDNSFENRRLHKDIRRLTALIIEANGLNNIDVGKFTTFSIEK
jgi:hypothetical protein